MAHSNPSQRRVLSVRLPEEHRIELETLATYDGVAIAEEIREAVKLLIASRWSDEEFRQRVRDTYEKARELLSRLEGAQEVLTALGETNEVAGPAELAARGEEELVVAG